MSITAGAATELPLDADSDAIENPSSTPNRWGPLDVLQRVPIAALVLVAVTYRRGGGSVVRQHDVLDALPPLFSRVSLGDFFAPPGSELDFMLGGLQREFIGSEFHIGNLLMVILPIVWALAVSELLIRLLAFWGMGALLRAIGVEDRGVLVAVPTIFSLVPFYLPAFGGVAGIPVLFAALVWIHDERSVTRRSAVVLAGFPLFSALPFNVPFAVMMLAAIAASLFVSLAAPWRAMLRGFGIFVFASVIAGWRLIYLTVAGPPSHRSEMVGTRDVTSALWEGIPGDLVGEFAHAEFGKSFVLGTIAVLGAGLLIVHPETASLRLRRIFFCAFGAVVLGIVISRVWPVVEAVVVAELLPDWGRLQLSRVRWLEPTMVMVLVAISSQALIQWMRWRRFRVVRIGGAVLLLAAVVLQGQTTIDMHRFRVAPDSPGIASYYAEGTFGEIRRQIEADNGELTVSVGLHPSVAIFNGIDVADGYWNGYPLEYKQRFRRLIAPALESDTSLRSYYDGWGSRVYVFQPALGRPGCCGPSTRQPIDLLVDATAWHELSITHVISPSMFLNADDIDLEFVATTAIDEWMGPIHLYRVRRDPERPV